MKQVKVISPTLKDWLGHTLSKRFKFTSWEMSKAHAFDANVAESLNISPEMVEHTFGDKEHSILSIKFADVTLDFNLVWKGSTASSSRAVIQSID